MINSTVTIQYQIDSQAGLTVLSGLLVGEPLEVAPYPLKQTTLFFICKGLMFLIQKCPKLQILSSSSFAIFLYFTILVFLKLLDPYIQLKIGIILK